ncbi:MAG TPA: VOC family protein [Bryobacteraceae bacterium]|jgi:methylmalonyl-CoA/ethylmalonyl-CoA epimerase|nr:VOC family protein [Bryobacteraceae bacterium]
MTIGQIAITVRDLERAVNWYRDVLGLRFLFSAGHLAFFDCDGVRLMLSRSEPVESVHSSVIYFKTDDIDASSRGLTEKGAALEESPKMIAKMPDHELWMAFFRDSEGNLLAFMSEVR